MASISTETLTNGIMEALAVYNGSYFDDKRTLKEVINQTINKIFQEIDEEKFNQLIKQIPKPKIRELKSPRSIYKFHCSNMPVKICRSCNGFGMTPIDAYNDWLRVVKNAL